jgi:hypothetical protein
MFPADFLSCLFEVGSVLIGAGVYSARATNADLPLPMGWGLRKCRVDGSGGGRRRKQGRGSIKK